MQSAPNQTPQLDDRPWYHGISRYQWMVLVIASLGWVFDVFEGQIFVASMNEAMPSLMRRGADETDEEFGGRKGLYDNIALGAFLLGGAVGGIVFGMLSDRIGRKRAMTLTIVFYSLFTFVSSFSMQWWHLAALRFLVAMGVGGEWAVASALVFEVFPKRARAHVGGIFHASSVFGTFLAVAAGTFLIANERLEPVIQDAGRSFGISDSAVLSSLKWRLGFALGVLPALLIIWIRRSLKEPESWHEAQRRAAEDQSQQVGRLTELFSPQLVRNTCVGFTLAAVGLATFWGVHIYGKNLLQGATQAAVLRETGVVQADQLPAEERARLLAPHQARIKRGEMLGMLLTTIGGGLGLVSFGPITHRIGRRLAFLLYHLGGLAMALIGFRVSFSREALLALLPVFGFLTLGMHAGYAIYFPELYPTRLRSTGTGFCFNGGRIAAAPVLFATGWLRSFGMTLYDACSLLSLLYLVGAAILLIAPETRGRELPE